MAKEGGAKSAPEDGCSAGHQQTIAKACVMLADLQAGGHPVTTTDYFGYHCGEEFDSTRVSIRGQHIEASIKGLGGTELWSSICPLFTVVGSGTHPATGLEVLVIEFKHYGRAKRIEIPRAKLFEKVDRLIPFLASCGFEPALEPNGQKCLRSLLLSIRAPHLHIASSCGWSTFHDDLVFILPNEVIGSSDSRVRVMVEAEAFRDTKLAKAGTFAKWQKDVAGQWRGNSRMILAASTMLTSAMLRFSSGVGSSVINLFGETTGGKTTTTVSAGTIWGSSKTDKIGFGHSWKTTPNALELMLAAHSGVGLALDELQTAPKDQVSAMAYGISAGKSKARGIAGKNGVTQAPSRSWQIVGLSTGEVTLAEHAAQGRGNGLETGGVEVRFANVPADGGCGMGVFENIHDHDTAREFADDLTQAGRMNHGHAGPMFIAKLIEHVKEVGGDDGEFDIRVADGVSGFVAGLGLGPEADPAVVRLASVFGLVAVTGCLASEFGVFPLMANEITAGVAKCFRDLIAVRGGSKNKVTASALVMIRDHIQTNRGRFLSYEKTNGAGGASVHRTPDLKAPHNHAGFIEYDTAERATGTVYVFPKVMKDEVLSKAPRSNLLKELVDRELLFKQDVADRFTIKKRVPGYGPGNYYAIDLTVMELNDDGSDPVAVVAKKVSKPRLSVIS